MNRFDRVVPAGRRNPAKPIGDAGLAPRSAAIRRARLPTLVVGAWATAIMGLCPIASRAAGTDIAALLKDADHWRNGVDRLQVETEVSVVDKSGAPVKQRLYRVYSQPGHKSLVLMRSPAEHGQKMLMLGDDYWLLMPSSQRPLRITPMQKLLGDASVGDIATLSWSEDYGGTLAGEEPCEADGKGSRCLHLSLSASRPGVSYQRIELWIGQARHEPVRADLYVASDKLAKRARFVLEPGSAPKSVNEMVLADELSSHQTTRVRYLSRHEREVPEAWLNPMFLARNPTVE